MGPRLALAIALTWVTPAMAQQRPECGRIDDLTAATARKYAEAPAFSGQQGDELSIIITVAPDGNWTVFRVSIARNVGCIIATGDGWHVFKPSLTGQPL